GNSLPISLGTRRGTLSLWSRFALIPAAPGCLALAGSSTRVGLVVTLSQPLGRHVGVNLRRAQAPVAEQFLHTANVRPGVEHVGGEAVAQCVWTRLVGQAGLAEILFEQPGHASRRQPRSALVEEKCRLLDSPWPCGRSCH